MSDFPRSDFLALAPSASLLRPTLGAANGHRPGETMMVPRGADFSALGMYNVLSYGADPSASDCSTAINRAISDCSANGGGVVYLPPGRYRVAKTITLRTGVILKGPIGCVRATFGNDGRRAPHISGAIIAPTGAFDVINTAPGVAAPFCGVEDLTVDGTAGGYWAMHFNSVSAGLRLRNVAIRSASPDFGGIFLDGDETDILGAHLENISVVCGLGHVGGTGIQLGARPTSEAHHRVANACRLTNIQILGMTTGFYDCYGGGNMVDGLDIEACATAVVMNSSQCIVQGGWVERNHVAFHFTAASSWCTVYGVRTAGGNATVVQIDPGAYAPRIMQTQFFNPLGHLTPQPALPAPGQSLTNNFGTDCTVAVTGNPSVNVSIGHPDPTARNYPAMHLSSPTNLSSGVFRVPVGGSFSLGYYTGSPAAVWFGE